MATKRIVLLLAITALLIAATAAPALALLTNGQAAPNFQLTDLSGTSHTLSEYRGKVVVIDFFGYACGYCQSDAKNTLVPLYNTYFKNDPNVQFLGVEIDGGSISQDQGFVQETGASWPILPAGKRRRFGVPSPVNADRLRDQPGRHCGQFLGISDERGDVKVYNRFA